MQFTERAVTYDYADLAEIALAWAVTIHKSQGSEYPVVVFSPVPATLPATLSRNLSVHELTQS